MELKGAVTAQGGRHSATDRDGHLACVLDVARRLPEAVGYASIGVEMDEAFAALAAKAVPALSGLRVGDEVEPAAAKRRDPVAPQRRRSRA